MAGWNEKRKVMRHYDRSAAIYDAQYAGEQCAKIEAALNDLSLKEDSSVLDVGCGTGLLFDLVWKTTKLVLGLDVSRGMLEEAKKRAKHFPNVHIVQADADHTPLPDKTFDAVFAVTLLQNTPYPILTLREIMRTATHESVIVVTGLKKEFSLEGFMRLLKEANLRISTIKTNGKLKGYVAVCRKLE